MSERERLRELIYAWEYEENKVSIADCDTDKSFERLIDKLLANGVIVPPCKVGDTVYSIMYGHNIIECKVAQITIEPYASIGMSFRCYGGMTFDMRHFGETVFLTRDEAEKALEVKT